MSEIIGPDMVVNEMSEEQLYTLLARSYRMSDIVAPHAEIFIIMITEMRI
jgi:hypothetical protein